MRIVIATVLLLLLACVPTLAAPAAKAVPTHAPASWPAPGSALQRCRLAFSWVPDYFRQV